jgi:hypothetical protein
VRAALVAGAVDRAGGGRRWSRAALIAQGRAALIARVAGGVDPAGGVRR